MRIHLIVAFICLLPLLSLADDQPKKPAKPRVEDVLRRAVIKAKTLDNLKFKRATVVEQEIDDEYGYTVILEFGTGDMGLYQGSFEAAKDKFVMIDSKDCKVLVECASRTYR